jgi:hypothetical protein
MDMEQPTIDMIRIASVSTFSYQFDKKECIIDILKYQSVTHIFHPVARSFI